MLAAMTGFQAILMGLIAELLVRTYHESQQKPTYTVRRVLRGSPGTGISSQISSGTGRSNPDSNEAVPVPGQFPERVDIPSGMDDQEVK
jgi:hypothetical protein